MHYIKKLIFFYLFYKDHMALKDLVLVKKVRSIKVNHGLL